MERFGYNNEGGIMAFLDNSGLKRLVDNIKNFIKTEINKITKTNIGLGNVDNTSDIDKPISTAQKNALDLKVDNAFTNVKIGAKTLSADTKNDTLELVAGSNIVLTPDENNDKITISSSATISSDARLVNYNNSSSNTSMMNVQDAINEIYSKLSNLTLKTYVNLQQLGKTIDNCTTFVGLLPNNSQLTMTVNLSDYPILKKNNIVPVDETGTLYVCNYYQRGYAQYITDTGRVYFGSSSNMSSQNITWFDKMANTNDLQNILSTLGITTTVKELNYVDGVTSNIQTQLNGKASTSVVTTSTNGVMSSTDKAKLDNTNIAYGTCSTAAATANKVIAISGNTNWSLKVGSIIIVKFTVTNTASNVKLNVNNTGAKNIWYNNAVYTGNSNSVCGYANRYTTYMYDGTNWVWISNGVDNNTTTFNNYMPASPTFNTYNNIGDFWTHCDSIIKTSPNKTISGRGSFNTFTPMSGWFRYFASSQNAIGNGQLEVGGSIILDTGTSLYYGKVSGGVADKSNLTVQWYFIAGQTSGGILYQSSEPNSGLVNNIAWIQ